jgi:hypothetical protein
LILLISCLANKANNPNVKMNYKDYKQVIQGGLGWTLVSWPEGATFAAPSNLKAGGTDHMSHFGSASSLVHAVLIYRTLHCGLRF